MNLWIEVKLKEMCERITVGHVGSMAGEYQESGIPFLRSLNIMPFRLNFENLKFIDGDFHRKLKKSALMPGDVAVVRTGYPGTACVIPESLPVSNCSDLVIVRPGKDLNPYFLAAIFNSTFGKDLVGGNLVGAAQQHFNITVAKELKLRFPPKPVQDKIVAVLSAYDDLIENHRRRIELLEQMAEELYREWFVRFRFPEYKHTKFYKGVPVGWSQRKLPEVAEITYGFPFEGARFNSDNIGRPIIRIRNIKSSDTQDFTDQVAGDKFLVHQGDLLIGMDGEFHMNHWSGEEAYLVQRVCKIKSKQNLLDAYISHALRAPIKHFEATIMGATVGHLGAKHLNSIDVLIPPDSLSAGLEMLNSIKAQVLNFSISARRLSQNRAALLGRLISGKLPVDKLDIQFPPKMREASEARQEVTHA